MLQSKSISHDPNAPVIKGETIMKKIFATLTVVTLGVTPLFGQSNLYKSIKGGNIEECKAILEKNPKLLDKEIPYHSYPIHCAAELFKPKVLAFLLEQKGRIRAKSQDKKGKNALIMLCEQARMPSKNNIENFKACAELLLKDGVDINASCKNGYTPLGHIARAPTYGKRIEDQIELLQFLVEKGADIKKLFTKKHSILAEICKGMRTVKKGDRKEKCKKGNSSYFRTVKALIEMGADPKCPDPENNNNTPLILVVKNDFETEDEKLENIKFLIESGASIKHKNKKGESAKSLAKASKDKKLYKIVRKTKKKKKKR